MMKMMMMMLCHEALQSGDSISSKVPCRLEMK